VQPRGGVRRDPRAESVPPEARITMPTRGDTPPPPSSPLNEEPAPRLVPERISARMPSAVAMLEAELARERTERESDQDQIAKMLVRVAALEKRVRDAETLAEEACESEKIAKRRARDLEHELEDTGARLAELDTAHKSKPKKPSMAPADDPSVKLKIADLESQIAEAESRLTLAQSAAEKSSERARAAEERNLEAVERIAALQGQLGAAQKDAKTAEKKLDDVEKDLREEQARAKEIEDRAATAAEKTAEKIQTLTRRMEEAEAEAEELRTQAKALHTRHEKERDDAKEAELEMRDTHKKAIAEQKEALDRVEKELADVRAMLKHAGEETTAKDAALREAEQDRDRLGTMMTKLGEQLATIQTRDREHTKELEALKSASARVVVLLEQLDAREKNVAVYRARAIAEARDLLQNKGAPTKATSSPFDPFDVERPSVERPKTKERRGVTPPPIPKAKVQSQGSVVDITDEAELVETLHPPVPKRSESPSIEVREDVADDDDDL
jgi:chromosome segregation ATPase